MGYLKNYYHDELMDDDHEECEGDFCHEEYDIIEPALTNEPMPDNQPPF